MRAIVITQPDAWQDMDKADAFDLTEYGLEDVRLDSAKTNAASASGPYSNRHGGDHPASTDPHKGVTAPERLARLTRRPSSARAPADAIAPRRALGFDVHSRIDTRREAWRPTRGNRPLDRWRQAKRGTANPTSQRSQAPRNVSEAESLQSHLTIGVNRPHAEALSRRGTQAKDVHSAIAYGALKRHHRQPPPAETYFVSWSNQ